MPPENTPNQTEAELWQQVAKERQDGAAPANEPPQPGDTQQQVQQQVAAPTPDAVDLRIQELLVNQQQNAQMLGEMTQQLKTAVGRIGSLQSELAHVKNERAAAAVVQPTQAQVQAAVQEPEKWKALKESFPDWAEAIEEFIKVNRPAATAAPVATTPAATAAPAADPSQQPQQQPKVEDLVAQVRSGVEQEMKQREEMRVDSVHPNWRATINTPLFMQWHAAQAPEVRALGGSDRSDDAIQMLNLFKQSVSSPSNVQDVRRQVLNSAVNQPGNASPRAQSLPEADHKSLAQLWKEEVEARKKSRESA